MPAKKWRLEEHTIFLSSLSSDFYKILIFFENIFLLKFHKRYQIIKIHVAGEGKSTAGCFRFEKQMPCQSMRKKRPEPPSSRRRFVLPVEMHMYLIIHYTMEEYL